MKQEFQILPFLPLPLELSCSSVAVGDSELALGSWAAVEIRGTIHTELPSLWSLFPAFSLGQRMFANNELVSVHTRAQLSSSEPWGCLKPALADAKPEGFGVFRSLDG